MEYFNSFRASKDIWASAVTFGSWASLPGLAQLWPFIKHIEPEPNSKTHDQIRGISKQIY